METEVHVFAFSVSANVLLSFFPFLIVMASITQQVLHWQAATDALYTALNSYFPSVIEEWLRLGERNAHNGLISILARQKFQLVSVLLLLFTANGIFEPLEVALNKVWGCKVNRSFVRNQVLSLGLIFVCGTLAMLSAMITGLSSDFWTGTPMISSITNFFTTVFFKLAALPISMFVLFLIYWLLPNCKVRPVDVIPAAIFVGFLLEVLKYVNLVSWVWMQAKMTREYGPFRYSVTIILWSFFASMLILAGAEWSARRARGRSADSATSDELRAR
jgi:membrane protein